MIRLFYNYYEDKQQRRKKEIDLCLQKNLNNQYINTFIIESQSKLTYDFFFDKINQLASDDDISIICNSDIYLDETVKFAESIKPTQVYALTRWEVDQQGRATFANRRDSQDTWIIRGKVRPVKGNFTLGTPGCDNRIAFEFQRAGYQVSNPSLTIKTYHVHSSQIRTYKASDAVPPPYLIVEPSKI